MKRLSQRYRVQLFGYPAELEVQPVKVVLRTESGGIAIVYVPFRSQPDTMDLDLDGVLDAIEALSEEGRA